MEHSCTGGGVVHEGLRKGGKAVWYSAGGLRTGENVGGVCSVEGL